MPHSTHLHSEIPLREVSLPLLLSLCNPILLILRQPSPDRASLLRSEIERHVLLVFIEDSKLRTLVGVDNGEDACNGFADVVAAFPPN